MRRGTGRRRKRYKSLGLIHCSKINDNTSVSVSDDGNVNKERFGRNFVKCKLLVHVEAGDGTVQINTAEGTISEGRL
jgi:hypothetical protein